MKNLNRTPRITAIFLLVGLLFASGSGTAIALGVPANPPAGSTFDQRLAQRKAEQKEQLDAKTQAHLLQVCSRYQTNIRLLQNSATTMANNRTNAYEKLDGTVLVSIGQIKLALLDTFTLEQDRTTMVQKVAAFEATATNYQQTLGDLLVINCQADPTGFQALLDTARAYYTQLQAQSTDISSYVTNTVEPVLQGFITQLQPKVSGDQ